MVTELIACSTGSIEGQVGDEIGDVDADEHDQDELHEAVWPDRARRSSSLRLRRGLRHLVCSLHLLM